MFGLTIGVITLTQVEFVEFVEYVKVDIRDDAPDAAADDAEFIIILNEVSLLSNLFCIGIEVVICWSVDNVAFSNNSRLPKLF
jgi:hypothetical protein